MKSIDSLRRLSVIEPIERGYKVSILGMGTEEGAPVKLGDGGFLKDKAGDDCGSEAESRMYSA